VEILERVKRRPNISVSDEVLKDYIQIISDRLCLRLGLDYLPQTFDSICVDATVKMVRRTYYEGISSEGAANISTSFVEDILAEYEQEIKDWKDMQINKPGGGKKVVKFI